MESALVLKVELPGSSLHIVRKEITNQEEHPDKVYKNEETAKTVCRIEESQECVPAFQIIHMSQEALDYFEGKEAPEKYKGTFSWSSLGRTQRLNWHLKEIAQSMGGSHYTYSVPI